ncbi:MAG: xanthine and dehydrogenase maturation factor, XdhC/CoxF family [Planctomycetota bacterium]|nr:xanthine and dehydrogenase maturation factor, XdhC/CoxF family [Planctomycetota bacterium]
MRDLIRSLAASLASGREVIHCQVVETRGSTPQKAGARMLVDPDGGQVGTLGGGCVEAEVKQKAIRRVGRPGAEIHSFILDHDYAWADGLICGGRMAILAEAIQGEDASLYFEALFRRLETGDGFTEALVIDPARAMAAVGSRILYDSLGVPVARYAPEGDAVPDVGQVHPLSDRPRPGVRDGVAFLPTLPRVRLVIVGAGHVGQAVADLAARADFDVWVVDDRHQYANTERFPLAERLVVGPMDEVLPALEITSNTFALIVTRGHGHDQEALSYLAPTIAPYVGLIGSRRKIRMIFEALREQGVPGSTLARVAAPVGIDIGSESVVEIAVSIVAELIARRNLGPLPQNEPAVRIEASNA